MVLGVFGKKLKQNSKRNSMKNKKILGCLLFLFVLICSVRLSAQQTKYKVEYSLEHYIYDRPDNDTNDDDFSELRVQFFNSGIDLYNEQLYFGTSSENGIHTIFDDIVTTPNPENTLKYFYHTECAENNWQPFNSTFLSFPNECREDLFGSPIDIWSPCTNFVHNYSRIAIISIGEEFNFTTLNPKATISFCDEEETILVTPFCTDGFSYELKIVVDGETTHTLLEYGPNPSTYSFNLSTIEDANSNLIEDIKPDSQIIFKIKYTDEDETSENSDIKTFTILPCVPELDTTVGENPKVISDVSCNEGNDASINMVFDRELTDDQKMVITLYRGNNTEGENFITLTKEDFDGTTSYLYDGNLLSEGDYRISWDIGSISGNCITCINPNTVDGFFSITEPEELSYTIESNTGIKCTENGTIDITPNGGSENYNYEWSGPDGATNIVSTQQDLSTDTPGEYILKLLDADVTDNSCYITSSPITIAAPPPNPIINILPSTTQPSSTNGGKGTIGISVTGTAPFQYSWLKDGSTYSASNDYLTNLDPGVYVVTVTDDNGCSTISEEITMNALPPLSVIIDQLTPINCVGDTTILTANVTNGSGSYLWSTNETTESIEVGPGTYTVTVTDSQDYTNIVDSPEHVVKYVDQDNNPITETLNVTATKLNDILCKGDNTGRISLNITGGVAPYEVYWDGSFTAGLEDNTSLSYGNHTYEVIDSNNCSISGGPIFINEPSEDFLVSATYTDVTSNGGNDGTITLIIQGGSGNYTYAWTKEGNSFTPTSGATPNLYEGFTTGNYQVIITEANGSGCTTTLGTPVFINEPGPLNLLNPQFIMEPVKCFGESTGTITARYTGSAPYLFEWFDKNGIELKSGTEDFISDLPVDIGYYYTIKDASNVTLTSDPIEITGPSAILEASTTQTEISCFGDNNGTITVNASGGTLPYSYQLNGGFLQASNTFSNLTSGTYTINVTDYNGCSISPITTILNPATPMSFEDTNAITPVSTPGGTDGAITVTVEGGTTPYYYQWTGPSGTLTPINTINTTTIQNLEEGTYTLTVSNKPTFTIDGCYLTKNYTVTEQEAFSIVSLTGTPSCNGQSNGTLTSTIEATGDVTFNWRLENGTLVATETTNIRTVTTENLPAGNYYLEVIDDTSRSIESSLFEIKELAEVSASITLTPSCSNNNTGSITFSMPTGSLTGDYLYSIDNGISFQQSPIFQNLEVRDYDLRVRATDNPNCDYIVPNVSVLLNPTILWDELNTTITRASGPEQSDGSISPTFTGGTPPFEYQWDANNATTQNITGLAEGTYTVTVTDSSGCSINQSFVVTEVGPLTITNITPTDAYCYNEATGSITTTVSGEGNITYEWSLANGDPIPVSNGTNTQNITGIYAGTYILTATDDNTTVSTAEITIGQPENALNITAINSTNISCFGGNDGELNIIAEGGTPPYMYSIDNGINFQSSASFINLEANSYTITVQDNQGCLTSSLTPILIIEPLELNIIINEQRSVSAANASDGAITITPTGGSGNYSYSWSGPNGYTSTEEDIYTLFAGDYTLTLKDENYSLSNGNGCIFTSNTITVTEPGVLLATINQSVELECNGDDFAEIIVNVQGGVEPYTYEWYQVNNTDVLLPEETSIISNLSSGTYFVRVTDANQISIKSQNVIVSEPNILQITLDNTTNILCAGEATGALEISVSGGTFPYSYVWDNGQTVQDISGLEAGEHTIEVIDDNGCFTQETFIITEPSDSINIVNSNIINASAYEIEDGSITIDVEGGLSPYNISWVNILNSSIVGNGNTVSNIGAGEYQVTILDNNNCTFQEVFEITQPDIVEETIIEPSCNGMANGSISVLVNKGNGTFTYNWNTGQTTSTIENLAAGSYIVTISGFGNGPITRTYTLEDPVLLEVNLGEDRVLCLDQELTLDATVEDNTATYSWISDNGFTSNLPSISPKQTGNYTVTITTENGCSAEGNIYVDITSDEINAELAVSSQAFTNENIIAVDISYPLPEAIEWKLPLGAEIITQNSDEVEFSFNQPGTYDIGIITKRGNCIAEKVKTIIIAEKDGVIVEDFSKNEQKIIEEFIVFPNPTNGEFTAEVNLTEQGSISIKVFSFANNQLIAQERDRGKSSYKIPFNLSGVPTGIYAVLLETPYGSTLRKIIIE